MINHVQAASSAAIMNL